MTHRQFLRGLKNSVCWVFKCRIYSEINEWPPLSVRNRQIGSTCLLHWRLSGLLTCTSQNHPLSDTLLRRTLEVIFTLSGAEKLYESSEWHFRVNRKLRFESAVGVWNMDAASGTGILKLVSVLLFSGTNSSQVKVKQSRVSYKMLQKGRKRKKKQIVRLCTHCVPGYLYRVKKPCRLHVSTWWELLNYWWMFLITSHKCWNTTLLQCLEEEGGP